MPRTFFLAVSYLILLAKKVNIGQPTPKLPSQTPSCYSKRKNNETRHSPVTNSTRQPTAVRKNQTDDWRHGGGPSVSPKHLETKIIFHTNYNLQE